MQFCSLLESNKAINFVSFETFRLEIRERHKKKSLGKYSIVKFRRDVLQICVERLSNVGQ